jgi:hypothetical protein
MLVVVVSFSFAACSSDQLRDLNYGTDAGVGFVPPDGSLKADLAPDTSEVAPDTTTALDGESEAGQASADSSAAGDG